MTISANEEALLLVRIIHHAVSFDIMSLLFNFPNVITKIDLSRSVWLSGLFVLNELSKKFNKDNTGLYRGIKTIVHYTINV